MVSTAVLAIAPDVVYLKDGTTHVGEIRSRRANSPGVVQLEDGSLKVVEPAADKQRNNGDGDLILLTTTGTLKFLGAEIDHVDTRRELTKTYEEQLQKAGRSANANAALSSWCCDHGLYPEAFDSADRAIDSDQDGPLARSVVDYLIAGAILDGTSTHQPVDEEQRERLLDRMSLSSASRTAFARSILLQVPAAELVPWLHEQLADVDPGVRAGAAGFLGDFLNDEMLEQLIRISLFD